MQPHIELVLPVILQTTPIVFQLYKASPWQTLLYLRLPSAMPYFLGGLIISRGLAFIGTVIAEERGCYCWCGKVKNCP